MLERNDCAGFVQFERLLLNVSKASGRSQLLLKRNRPRAGVHGPLSCIFDRIEGTELIGRVIDFAKNPHSYFHERIARLSIAVAQSSVLRAKLLDWPGNGIVNERIVFRKPIAPERMPFV